jgi:hypothetical protein
VFEINITKIGYNFINLDENISINKNSLILLNLINGNIDMTKTSNKDLLVSKITWTNNIKGQIETFSSNSNIQKFSLKALVINNLSINKYILEKNFPKGSYQVQFMDQMSEKKSVVNYNIYVSGK